MQLKELIIKNFKSFDYTKIPFKKGLHVVVGPNGSGKSNIIDALLFVFGATSLKKLRVDKLVNLINHNNKANTAKVRVVMDNDGEDIEISREIDKDGKSIFLLNNKRKALHEITSYLNELGIDMEGYNTVQQGDVTKIINLNAEERREIIDNVSGIALFDARKKEAETNLKKVQERLDKVYIALNERKPYVEQLKEEKESAIKFKELDLLENTYNFSLFKKQINSLTQEIYDEEDLLDKNQTKIDNLISEKKHTEIKIKELDKELETINQELISHSEKVQSTIGKNYSEISANKEIILNNININKENLNYLETENYKATTELSSFKTQIDDLLSLIENIDLKLKSKITLKTELKKNLDKTQKEFEKVKVLQDQLYLELSNYNKKIISKQDQFYEIKNRINAYTLQKETLEIQDKESLEALSKLKQKANNLDKEITEYTKLKEDLDKKILNLKTNLSSKKEEKENIYNNLNNIKAEISSLKKDFSLSSNFLDKRKEINTQLKKFPSYVGFLEDCVKLNDSQKSYYSSYVVLKDDLQIEKIVNLIDYNLSFVILSALELKEKDLEKYFNKLKVVSPKVSVKNLYFDGFSFKRLIFKDSKKLQDAIKDAEKKKSELESKLETLIKEYDSLDKDIDLKLPKLSNTEIKLNTCLEIKKDVVEKLDSIQLEKNNTLLERITLNVGHLESELTSLDKDIKENSSKKEEIEESLKKINFIEQNKIRNQYDDLISEVNHLEQSLMSKNSDLKILNEKKENKINYINSNLLKIKELKEKIIVLEDRKVEIDNSLLKIKSEFEKEDSKKAKLFDKKTEVNKMINDLSYKLNSYDSTISDINLSINNSKILISTNQSKISQFEQNLKLLDLDKFKDLKQVNLETEEINSELRKIRREKNSLGNINFNAIESYDKLAKEYDEIISKCEILEKEKEQVSLMLSEINMKKKTVFEDCFTKINKEFKNIIKKMSSNLSGDLELVGDDLLKSKLLINLTKNNKTKDIDIMSGGEKTITALAIIFALHAYKNAPYYILDEVDAALDDYNSATLLNYIKDLSSTTTIISITHNSTIVSGANQIIGVTLKENTTVIGLNLK